METFWFFRLRFRRAYDSDFRFSPGHKRSFVSHYDSDASENQPLAGSSTIPGHAREAREQLLTSLAAKGEIAGNDIVIIGNKGSCPWQHRNFKSKTLSAKLRRALLNWYSD